MTMSGFLGSGDMAGSVARPASACISASQGDTYPSPSRRRWREAPDEGLAKAAARLDPSPRPSPARGEGALTVPPGETYRWRGFCMPKIDGDGDALPAFSSLA